MINAAVLSTDNEIVEALKNGNQKIAADVFVKKYQNFVYLTALRYLTYDEDAQDAAQEIFIKAIDSIAKFRGESSLKTWLYRITKNYCLNSIRKNKFFSFFSLSSNENESFEIKDETDKTGSGIENEELEKKFLKALSKLPEKQRETFALRYFEEMTYEEISKVLGTSVGGLKANYFQAVKKLAVELEEFRNK